MYTLPGAVDPIIRCSVLRFIFFLKKKLTGDLIRGLVKIQIPHPLTIVATHLLRRLLYSVQPELLVHQSGQVGGQGLPKVDGQRGSRPRGSCPRRRRRRRDDGEGTALI